MASHGNGGGVATAMSVVVPFYNLERYVRPCLDSVVAAFARLSDSARQVIEVVCVDDGSTDSTGNVLDAYSRDHQQSGLAGLAFCVVHKPNGGEGSARNVGIEAAHGRWVTFLDGDDVWLENHLEVALPLIAAHPTADIVALKYANFDDGGECPKQTAADSRVIDVSTCVPSEVLLEVGVFPTFFRREFLEGLRFSSLPLGADRLHMAQCFAKAHTVVKCDAVVHGYRVRQGSMARAAWNARKVSSQCDYAFGSLEALASSGKRIGREGFEYVASLWLSDVPNRLARLVRRERRAAWKNWRMTLGSDCVRRLPRFDRVRRLIMAFSFSMAASICVARLLRKAGIS